MPSKINGPTDMSAGNIILLLFQRAQFFVNWPVGKSEEKGHNYIHDWYEH